MLCAVLKITVSSYFETNVVLSYDTKREGCLLTLEDIDHFEGIIAPKDDKVWSQLPGNDPNEISVPTDV